MKTTFRITHWHKEGEYLPYDGTVTLSPLSNISHGGITLNFSIQTKNLNLEILGDLSKSEKKEHDDFISNTFPAKCYHGKDILNQKKVKVTFGDYPNGDALLMILDESEERCFPGTYPYYIEILSQEK